MADPGKSDTSRRSLVTNRPGLRLGEVFGIEIRLDFSVAIIFFLVTYSLGSGAFPQWHPDWSFGLSWTTALAAGLLLFASLLAHELAHSVVAQLRGIRVPRITLFLFGGVSEMQQEPSSPQSELLIAIVGPLTSLVLGIGFTWLGMSLAGDVTAEQLVESLESAASNLSPVATLLLWLGPVNLFLAIFNLLPGFPLDGGRVFRAAVWWATGNQERATRIAARAGMGVAWGMMALGFLQLFQGAFIQGLWLMLIGWFLQSAARSSQTQVALQQSLGRLSVQDLMRTRFETVRPDTTVETFIEENLLRSGQTVWPVVDDDRLIGMISFEDARLGLRAGLGHRAVANAMRPIEHTIAPQLPGRDALQAMLGSDSDPLPVVDHGRIVGLLYRADIMRWLAIHQLRADSHAVSGR